MTDTKIKADTSAEHLFAFRHRLHQLAELSGNELKTSRFIQEQLEKTRPTQLLTNIGGHGIAAVFEGKQPGPTVLFRADLDGLPIHEQNDLGYVSETTGVSHKCGHDGHMTILLGLAERLAAHPPQKGRAVLLFQPAEETGEGARRVLGDPRFQALGLDWAFAIHNLPGFSQGSVLLKSGHFAATSEGFIAELTGATSHAGEPHAGKSPVLAVAELIQYFSAMPQFYTELHQGAKVTVIHAKVGEPAFGTSPAHGTVMATLRAYDESVLRQLKQRCEEAVRARAETFELDWGTRWTDFFPQTFNNTEAVSMVQRATERGGLQLHELENPFAWTEDFGHFTGRCKGALIGLGAGKDHPSLHHPQYDFPDSLIHPGVTLFDEIARELLKEA